MLFSSACSHGAAVPGRATSQRELLQRPTLEAETARLVGVRDAIRTALSTQLGLTRWHDDGDANRAGCADFNDLEAETGFSTILVLDGGVPDGQWGDALRITTDIAGRNGYGRLEVVVDKPGEHSIVLLGERGSRLDFGSALNATLAVRTGCHLPAAAHYPH